MSGRKRGKNLTTSLLKRRGWTPELIEELLSKPRYIPHDGHMLPV